MRLKHIIVSYNIQILNIITKTIRIKESYMTYFDSNKKRKF